MEKVKLYWWKDYPNFGDAASPYIMQKLFGLDVVYCNPSLCIHREIFRFLKYLFNGKRYVIPSFQGYVCPWKRGLFAIGSILDNSFNIRCSYIYNKIFVTISCRKKIIVNEMWNYSYFVYNVFIRSISKREK